MTDLTEVIDINSIGDPQIITLNQEIIPQKSEAQTADAHINKPSSNFGGGIELLMNDKRKSDNSKISSNDVNNDDLNDLENQLNNLSADIESKTPKSV